MKFSPNYEEYTMTTDSVTTEDKERLEKSLFEPSSFEEVFKLWSKYEDIAMHFNDLLIRLRIQALGSVTISGTLATAILKPDSNYISLKFVFPFFLVAWLAIYCLDMWYYNRLLSGAADAIIKLEEKYANFQLSTETAKEIRNCKNGRLWFYGTVSFGLVIISVLLWLDDILKFIQSVIYFLSIIDLYF